MLRPSTCTTANGNPQLEADDATDWRRGGGGGGKPTVRRRGGGGGGGGVGNQQSEGGRGVICETAADVDSCGSVGGPV